MQQKTDSSRLLLLLKPECWQLSQLLLQEGCLRPFDAAVRVFQPEFAVYEEDFESMDIKPDELELKLRRAFPQEEFYRPTEREIGELAFRIRETNHQLEDLYRFYYLIGGPLPVVCRKQLIWRVGELINKKDNISHSSTAISRERSHSQRRRPTPRGPDLQQLGSQLAAFSQPIPSTDSVPLLLKSAPPRNYYSVKVHGLLFTLVVYKFDRPEQLRRFVDTQRKLQALASPFIAPLYYYDLQKINQLELGLAFRLQNQALQQTLLSGESNESQKISYVLQLQKLVQLCHEAGLTNLRFNQDQIFVGQGGRVNLLWLKVGEEGDYLQMLQQVRALQQRWSWGEGRATESERRANDWAQLARVCGSLIGQQAVSSYQMAKTMTGIRGRGESELCALMHDLIEKSFRS